MGQKLGYARVKLGYARVSRNDQNLALQLNALEGAGCDSVFKEPGMSGANVERPVLEQALSKLAEGDTLIVYKLDRLGRSLPHLVSIMERIREKRANFCSLTESIDTNSAYGEFFFHVNWILRSTRRGR